MDARQTHGDGRKARPGAWATLAAVLLWSALPQGSAHFQYQTTFVTD